MWGNRQDTRFCHNQKSRMKITGRCRGIKSSSYTQSSGDTQLLTGKRINTVSTYTFNKTMPRQMDEQMDGCIDR